MLSLVLFAPVLLFGFAKVQIGMDRGRPVGILVFLLFAALGGAVFATIRRPARSRAGDARLSEMRSDMSRLLRGPTESELPLALVLGGTAVLLGTPYAALAQTSQRAGADGSSGCGSDCGGCSSSC
jgi:uncharacterized protein (TIGR04222 family)